MRPSGSVGEMLGNFGLICSSERLSPVRRRRDVTQQDDDESSSRRLVHPVSESDDVRLLFDESTTGKCTDRGPEWHELVGSAQRRMRQLAGMVQDQEDELNQLRARLLQMTNYGSDPEATPASPSTSNLVDPRFAGSVPEATADSQPQPVQPVPSSEGEKIIAYTRMRTVDGGWVMPAVRKAWTVRLHNSKASDERVKTEVEIAQLQRSQLSQLRFGEESKGRCSAVVLSPNSPTRMFWDLLCTMFIAYDVVMLPLVAFGKDDWRSVYIVSHISVIFWTCDMVISFISGYNRPDGAIEMSLSMSMYHYATSWFPLDICVLILDWFLVFFSQNSELAALGRANKLARFVKLTKLLRFIRLARVAKLVPLYEEICEHTMTPAAMTAVSILRLLLSLGLFVHYVACGWYAVGQSQVGSRESWLTPWLEEGAKKNYLYVISYHWTMAQFLPAPCADHPKNLHERIFTILVLFAGFLVFTSTLGSVTALITQSKKYAWENMMFSNMLRRFYVDNKVSHDLATRVTTWLTHQKAKEKAFVLEGDVPSLSTLPVLLQMEVRFEMHMKTLCCEPWLNKVLMYNGPAASQMCNEVVSEKTLHKGDVPFRQHDKGVAMRFVKNGELSYFPFEQAAPNASEVLQVLHAEEAEEKCGKDISIFAEDYIGVAVLWVEWTHVGFCTAAVASRVLEVNAEIFGTVVARYPHLQHRAVDYAEIFAEQLKAAGSFGESYPDDTFTLAAVV